MLALLTLLTSCTAPVTQHTPLTVVGTGEATTTASTSATTETTTASTTVPTATTGVTTGTQTSTPQTKRTTAATTPSTAVTGHEDVSARFEKMSVEEKVGQLFVVPISGVSLGMKDRELLKSCSFGNVILFGSNIRDASQLSKLTTAIQDEITANTGLQPFIGVDQEGGTVQRLLFATTSPPAMAVGATRKPALAKKLGMLMGEQLLTLGINVNFAPDADVNSNPDNPVIGDRSYSEDAKTCAKFVSAYVEGLQSAGVLACAKHFPGHGDTSVDSHETLPTVTGDRERLDTLELVPFRAAIEADVAMTMVGHLLVPALTDDGLPASLSQDVIEGTLRGEMNFSGLVITDSLSMGAITETYGLGQACVMAINAGADLLCLNSSAKEIEEAYDTVLAAVEKGKISQERLDDAVLRILDAKEEYGIFESPRPSEELPSTEEYDALLTQIAEESLTLMSGTSRVFDASQTFVIATEPYRDVLTTRTENLGAYLTRNYGCASTEIERKPDSYAQQMALDSAKLYETVVLAVSGEGCLELARILGKRNLRLIIVVMDDPYTAREYMECGAKLVYCAYENTDYAILAVAKALTEGTAK